MYLQLLYCIGSSRDKCFGRTIKRDKKSSHSFRRGRVTSEQYIVFRWSVIISNSIFIEKENLDPRQNFFCCFFSFIFSIHLFLRFRPVESAFQIHIISIRTDLCEIVLKKKCNQKPLLHERIRHSGVDVSFVCRDMFEPDTRKGLKNFGLCLPVYRFARRFHFIWLYLHFYRLGSDTHRDVQSFITSANQLKKTKIKTIANAHHLIK